MILLGNGAPLARLSVRSIGGVVPFMNQTTQTERPPHCPQPAGRPAGAAPGAGYSPPVKSARSLLEGFSPLDRRGFDFVTLNTIQGRETGHRGSLPAASVRSRGHVVKVCSSPLAFSCFVCRDNVTNGQSAGVKARPSALCLPGRCLRLPPT